MHMKHSKYMLIEYSFTHLLIFRDHNLYSLSSYNVFFLHKLIHIIFK